MGRDIAASAKDFEEHAKSGYIPGSLARELHNMDPADRLAVAKQVDWDMKHQSNSALPKLEFYDSGDLKSIETSGKSDKTDWTEHYELDKDNSNVRVELKTYNTNTSYDHSFSMDLTERDADGKLTRMYSQSNQVDGTRVTVNSSDEKFSYDSVTKKQVTHDRKTSWGETLHEEYDATTGKQKSFDETTSKGTIHRSYDATTGNLREEDRDNADKTHETFKYDSNGDKVSREKQYGDHGDKGTRQWLYDRKSGKEVYTEWRAPNGDVTKTNIDENGHYHDIKDE